MRHGLLLWQEGLCTHPIISLLPVSPPSHAAYFCGKNRLFSWPGVISFSAAIAVGRLWLHLFLYRNKKRTGTRGPAPLAGGMPRPLTVTHNDDGAGFWSCIGVADGAISSGPDVVTVLSSGARLMYCRFYLRPFTRDIQAFVVRELNHFCQRL